MADPKVSEKKMLDWLEGIEHDWDPEDIDEDMYQAIRAAIEERGRLREKVRWWQSGADNLLYSDLERYPWIKATSKFLDDIRVFKLDGEEEK